MNNITLITTFCRATREITYTGHVLVDGNFAGHISGTSIELDHAIDAMIKRLRSEYPEFWGYDANNLDAFLRQGGVEFQTYKIWVETAKEML